MGHNTTIILYNDMSSEWPKEIRQAMQCWQPPHCRTDHFAERGDFGYGHVISHAHADGDQVCIVGGNLGRPLSPLSAPEMPGDLTVLADLLRAHGYSVQAPGEEKAKGPFKWGYYADQQAKKTEGA